ncbi:hypothetical protein [Oleiagrimonas sp. C23AA]|uniref:hypothetical protein n=1 Tax=Oleiagrimonas sp. C23AA TaxID=2719047 RepID=UPI00142191B2|nr:hypothetical protein [Oleiagrimonas sp. C23AA]NII11573.1 hypothetical protein [Oleiagrimonas sp. C23AA]
MRVLHAISQGIGLIFAIVSAAMIGLAAGAIWMLLSAYMQRGLPWLIILIGLVVGLVTRAAISRSRWLGPLLAALGTAMAYVYLLGLSGAMLLAGTFGMSFGQALRHAGFAMLADIAWFRLGAPQLVLMLIGMAIAAFTAHQVIARGESPQR